VKKVEIKFDESDVAKKTFLMIFLKNLIRKDYKNIEILVLTVTNVDITAIHDVS